MKLATLDLSQTTGTSCFFGGGDFFSAAVVLGWGIRKAFWHLGQRRRSPALADFPRSCAEQ